MRDPVTERERVKLGGATSSSGGREGGSEFEANNELRQPDLQSIPKDKTRKPKLGVIKFESFV